jgi:beta-xylosidase
MKGRYTIALALALLCGPATTARASQFDAPVTCNPLVPGYYADPCVRKFGDTYYLYATPDGWGVGRGRFCIWTSKDFVHWTAHKSNWPNTDFKWAPSVVHANGKFYMYTQVPCQVWVGVSDTPLGPWTNPIPGGGPMILDQTPKGTITLDGECFIDTDGQAYLMYGTWWTPTIVKLNRDLISWTEKPVQFFSRQPGYTPPNGTVKGCMEAPYMLKHKGVYYYMYSDFYCGNSTYCVEYSTGPSPLGPWTYGANNPILSTNADDTVDGPGHNTIIEDGGKTYIVYHRHDNPHHPDGSHRQVVADEMTFAADGSIRKIVPSHLGIGFLAPSTVRDTNWVVDPSLHVSANLIHRRPRLRTSKRRG